MVSFYMVAKSRSFIAGSDQTAIQYSDCLAAHHSILTSSLGAVCDYEVATLLHRFQHEQKYARRDVPR